MLQRCGSRLARRGKGSVAQVCAGALVCAAALCGAAPATAGEPDPAYHLLAADAVIAASAAVPDRDPLLDRTQSWVHDALSQSARRLDGLFGPAYAPWHYERTNGSIAPALMWDEFRGWRARVRFRVNVPLPRMDERFGAFIGRVSREEYVTERAEPSGAFPRQYGPVEDDQTLAGVAYREPWHQGWRFDAGAGVRVRTPLDPYVKGGFIYERGNPRKLLFSARETLFWQNSEQLGLTSRLDFARIVAEHWMVRSTVSGTASQETRGVRGYASLMALRPLPFRRAIALQIGAHGETEAEVPLREYGLKAAWRQSIARDWLILELRTSLGYPKDFPGQPRHPSWGVGVGLEMCFGTDEFSAQPVTF